MLADANVHRCGCCLDGSKFKAVNSKPNNFTPQKAKDHIERVEQSINHYLNKQDEADNGAESDTCTKLTATKLAWLQKRLREFQEIQQAVAQQPDKRHSSFQALRGVCLGFLDNG